MSTTNKLTFEDVKEDVKALLDLDGTNMYDKKLELYVNASFSKLSNEGVQNVFDKKHIAYSDYVLCLALEVSKYIDTETDFVRANFIANERKLILREMISNEKL